MFMHAFITSQMVVSDIIFSPVGTTFSSGTTYPREEHSKAIMSRRKKNKKNKKPEGYFVQPAMLEEKYNGTI